jgi:signal transduction histidine kinase
MADSELQSVLIIDDSQDIHDLIEVRLRPEGVRLYHAFDAEAALALIRHLRPDLLLLDLDLPGQSGLELCRQLKADLELSAIPVIFLTGTVDVEAKVQAFDAGATDYITKPFDAAELRARVRAALRTKRQAMERQKLAMLGLMSAVMAHELRNPLASAKGNSQLLTEMLEPGSRSHRKAEQVVQELVRVETLINDLLDFARSGRVHRRPCDPAALAQEATSRLEDEISIEVDTSSAPASWSLDPSGLERVLTNLLRNAVQAQGESKAPLRLTAAQRGEELYLAVRDHGPGLARDIDVFAPFVTTKITGAGLGLAISRQIVQAHGGRISLKDHPEGGAIAELFIPAENGA